MDQSIPKVHHNELILVSKYQGRVDVWVGWKRALAAFADPRVWESTDQWPDYFTRQDAGVGYGMAGYGLVVMDLDTKQGWSINDFSHPGSFHLPNDYELEGDDESGARAAFAQMLARPDQWASVRFDAFPVGIGSTLRLLMGRAKSDAAAGGGSSGQNQLQELLLSELADPKKSVEENQRDLVISRGVLTLPGNRAYILLSGKYAPKGWAVSNTLGRSDLEVLEECLTNMKTLGFPPPARDLVLPFVEEQAFESFEDGEIESDEDVVALFSGLLEDWGKPPDKALRPG